MVWLRSQCPPALHPSPVLKHGTRRATHTRGMWLPTRECRHPWLKHPVLTIRESYMHFIDSKVPPIARFATILCTTQKKKKKTLNLDTTFFDPVTYRRHLRDLKMGKEVRVTIKYWRPPNEQGGQMHTRTRAETRFSECRVSRC